MLPQKLGPNKNEVTSDSKTGLLMKIDFKKSYYCYIKYYLSWNFIILHQ